MKRRAVVDAADAGRRLDQFLPSVVPGSTRSSLRALFESGDVRLDGEVATPSTRVKSGQVVECEERAPEPSELIPEKMKLDVVFEDATLLIVNKPAGLVVHPGAGHRQGTLANGLLAHVKKALPNAADGRPGLVHRLDRETSGLLLVAKTDAALRALQTAFKAREVRKTYLAVVHGAPPPEGTFRTLHGRHPVNRKRFSTRVLRGKSAVTHYRVVEQFARAALVEVELETGRTHQIRAHFADAGFPIVGDALYGGVRKHLEGLIERTALHAAVLEFEHPRTHKRVSFQARPPADFAHALVALRAPAGR